MKKTILLLLLMLLPMVASAYVEIDGIYYEIGGDTATVVAGSTKYSGEIIIPETITYHGSQYLVTAIEGGVYMYGGAFRSCPELNKVTLPNSVKTIGDYAFNGCYALTEFTIPISVKYIGDRAFMDCIGLTNMIIPDSVFYLGESSLRGCSGLTSVTIGNSVRSISSSTFWDCTNLQSVTIGSSVTHIGTYAWEYCNQLKEVHISDIGAWSNIHFEDEKYSNPLYYAHHLYLNDEEIENLVIPNGVTHVSDYAFFSCYSFTSVTIPNTVTSIGSAAFSGCSNIEGVFIFDLEAWCNIYFDSNSLTVPHHLYLNNEEIINLEIPNTVTSINNNSFLGCYGLKSVEIPNSVTTIGAFAFEHCTGLERVNIPNSIVSIEKSSFAYCTSLTNVNIPNSVISIGEWAFQRCSSLLSINIPNSVTSLGNGAFSGCEGLTSVVIPNSITAINAYTFSYCRGLKNVSIPNTVTSIGKNAFENCSNLMSASIPNSVTSIGERAFSNCTALTNVSIPNSVKTICDYAFQVCGFESIVIPNSVTTIDTYAFGGCPNLTNIVIPNSVISMKSPFGSSKRISSLIITGEGEWQGGSFSSIQTNPKLYIDSRITDIKGIEVPHANIYCFAAIPPSCDDKTYTDYSGTLHVPATSLAAYFISDYWCNFENIVGDAIEPEEVNVSQNSIEVSIGTQFNLTATVAPANSTPNTISWRSTNPMVATVNNGIVTTICDGECDIIAECLYKRDTCHVVVNDTTVTITLDQQEAMVLPNHIITLTPSASPIMPALAVTSSDPSVAAARVVNHKVQVVGIKEGTTTITVGSVDGTAIPATCLVTVYTEPGDMNCDGFVNISDVTSLIDYLLSDDDSQISTKNADVNGDERINISDVTTLIDILLSGN